MMTFLEWNDAIAGHFFRPENAGRTVYLYVTEHLLDELGAVTGETFSTFISAMQAGPPWATRSGLCQKAIQGMANWRARPLQCPPYVGYLALFVLAAGHEGEFAPHAYYPRLRELLGEPAAHGQYPSFHKMLELWSDLEQWASRDKRGALGLLRLDIAGSWLHVGLPVAQTILTETERQHLHGVFAEAGLDSNDPPSDAELARIISRRGAGHLRPRTLSALSLSQVESDYSSVLLDRILEELESWTEEIPLSGPPLLGRPVRGSLHFGLQLDGTARRATFPLHARLRGTALESATVTHDGIEYTANLLADGHSGAFFDANHCPLDGAQLEWQRPITFVAGDDLVLHAPPCNVRVFTDGSAFGVSGFIETRLLDPARPFALASTGGNTDHVRAWGYSSCLDFREHEVSGLPAGWALFTAARAANDAAIREHVPQLSFSRRFRRIRLDGGLRLPGMAQYYFRFAPPVVRLEGARENAEVRFNDDFRVERDSAGTFSIPDELLEEDTISAACEDGGITRRRLISLRDQLDEHGTSYAPRRYGPTGRVELPSVGAFLTCGVPETPQCPAPVALLFLEPSQSAVLLGAQPGQIVPYEPTAPPPWEPVWAVIHHRRSMTARFVGQSPLPPDSSRGGNGRAIRDWKDVLWHQRRRIDSPPFEPARRLWQAYQVAARHA